MQPNEEESPNADVNYLFRNLEAVEWGCRVKFKLGRMITDAGTGKEWLWLQYTEGFDDLSQAEKAVKWHWEEHGVSYAVYEIRISEIISKITEA